MNVPLIDNAKMLAPGQVTIPKAIRMLLNITAGDRVTFICEGDYAILMSTDVFAKRTLHKPIKGGFEKAGFSDDDNISELRRHVSAEIEGL